MEASFAQVMAFMAFAAVAAGTPGPSNVLLAAVGARVGVRRGMKSLLGQVTGMTAMLFAVTLGLGGLLLDHAWTLETLKWGGAALLCWMAWGIATADRAEEAAEAPTGFLGMAAFQWANPKGWLIAAAADATFLDRHGGALSQALVFSGLFLLAALPSCLPWLAFGAALQRFLRTPRTWLVFRCTMAGLLAASVVLFVVPHA
ncbi:LysE family translocator [Actinomadura napierensis]|uniref:LysE family translocator n=1 Tax=Actinomadura napierensis TaxID=267854 RepID=A0ABN3AGY4_9ACTN